MTNLNIEKTSNTPQVIFDPTTGIFYIEGRSIPENPNLFYLQLLEWLNDYYINPKSITELHIKLEYINSGSTKALLDILRLMKSQYEKGNKCKIIWYSEEDDESVQELGEHYQYTLKIPFEFHTY